MANEKRLIDANALMDAFREYMMDRYDKEKCVSEENCKTCEHSCLWRKIVSASPIVDAVEVVHGYWISHYAYNDCSVCGDSSDDIYKYCPHCGAKMDGEVRNEATNEA